MLGPVAFVAVVQNLTHQVIVGHHILHVHGFLLEFFAVKLLGQNCQLLLGQVLFRLCGRGLI